jgi:hypothetical protein
LRVRVLHSYWATLLQNKFGESPANSLINQGVMATLQERRLGYHSRAILEPKTSGFLIPRINHYATRGDAQRKCTSGCCTPTL